MTATDPSLTDPTLTDPGSTEIDVSRIPPIVDLDALALGHMDRGASGAPGERAAR